VLFAVVMLLPPLLPLQFGSLPAELSIMDAPLRELFEAVFIRLAVTRDSVLCSDG
jgi:hypothetical protein